MGDPKYPVDVLREYVGNKGIAKGKTAEETLNRILESLSEEWGNRKEDAVEEGGKKKRNFRDELISACAVSLMGLGRIKDPVKLFSNITRAFERRGYCIYRPVVRRAFARLEDDAQKRGRIGEIIKIWENLGNNWTKANSVSHIPNGLAMKLRSDWLVFSTLVENLTMKRDFPLSEVEKFLTHPQDEIKLAASKGLIYRKGLGMDFLKGMLKSKVSEVRCNAAHALSMRAEFPLAEIEKLLKQGDSVISAGVRSGLAERRFLLPSERKRLLDGFPGTGRNWFVIEGIHGKRGKRKRIMRKLMRPLRA